MNSKEFANVCTPDHPLAVLIKAALDAVMELDHIKNKAALSEHERDRVTQIVERGHDAINDVQRANNPEQPEEQPA